MAEESKRKTGANKWDALIFLLDKFIDKAHVGTLVIVGFFCFLIYSMTRNLESEDSRILIEQFIATVFGGDRRTLVIWVLLGCNLFTIVLATRKIRQQLKEIRRLTVFRDAYVSHKEVILRVCFDTLKAKMSSEAPASLDNVREELNSVLDGHLLDVAKKSSEFRLK
ncbi:MAG: hypothetical protein L3K26_07265 [Candidatus Hydrogenedentes bacterium]|nr:hypothetical protein [Candidatus Hydrogenedentota bacterium]